MSGIPVRCKHHDPLDQYLGTKTTQCNAPREDLPWTQRPASQYRTDNLPPTNVDVPREQHSHVVCRRQRVCRDVRAKRGEDEGERREKRGRTVVPVVNEAEWVPGDVAVERDAGGGHGNAHEADEGEYDGDDEQLDALCLFVLGVALRY